MSQVMLEDAATRLDQLIDQANRGEEVIITRGSTPVAKLVPVPPGEAPKPKRSGYGNGKDNILYMADDFDAPLEDFKDYM
ncbi:MAG: type II toxin-antitoxin system Phd/YefM family antitoxin [Janthinobacterium lividum]